MLNWKEFKITIEGYRLACAQSICNYGVKIEGTFEDNEWSSSMQTPSWCGVCGDRMFFEPIIEVEVPRSDFIITDGGKIKLI